MKHWKGRPLSFLLSPGRRNAPSPGLLRRPTADRSRGTLNCDQVTTLEKALLLYPPLGRLTDETLQSIEEGLKLALQLL